MARFSLRLPPRLRRWRWIVPDEAGTGAVPLRAAKRLSEAMRRPVAHLGKDASNHQRPDADDLDQTCPAFHHQAPDVDIEISDL